MSGLRRQKGSQRERHVSRENRQGDLKKGAVRIYELEPQLTAQRAVRDAREGKLESLGSD